MGRYVNIKCGKCGHSLTGGYYRTGTLDNFSRLGPEYIPCGQCGHKNSIGRVPFTKMNIVEKIWVLILVAFNGLVLGGLVGAMIGGFLFKSPIKGDDTYILRGLLIGFLVVGSFLIWRFLRDVKKDGY